MDARRGCCFGRCEKKWCDCTFCERRKLRGGGHPTRVVGFEGQLVRVAAFGVAAWVVFAAGFPEDTIVKENGDQVGEDGGSTIGPDCGLSGVGGLGELSVHLIFPSLLLKRPLRQWPLEGQRSVNRSFSYYKKGNLRYCTS